MIDEKKITLSQYSRVTSVEFVTWITGLKLHKKKRTRREWSILQAAHAAAYSKEMYEVPAYTREVTLDICLGLCLGMGMHRRPEDSLDLVQVAISRLTQVQADLETMNTEKREYLDRLSAKMVAEHRKAKNSAKRT